MKKKHINRPGVCGHYRETYLLSIIIGMAQSNGFTESNLESSILSNLQKFLMELGKGYAFVARQQHIRTEKEDYYIDICVFHGIT